MKNITIRINVYPSSVMFTYSHYVNDRNIDDKKYKNLPSIFWEIINPLIKETLEDRSNGWRLRIKTFESEHDIDLMFEEHEAKILSDKENHKEAVEKRLLAEAEAEKKEIPEILLSWAKERHNCGESLSGPGGYSFVDDVLAGDNFIVYKVTSKNWNPYGGQRNSGITMAEGIYAFDGIEELTIKPWGIYRDGENQYNDNWDNCHYLVSLKGNILTLRNSRSGALSQHKLDFRGGGDK